MAFRLPSWLHPVEPPEGEAVDAVDIASDENSITSSPLFKAWQQLQGADIPVPQMQTMPMPTAWDNMGAAFAQVQPYSPIAGESGWSAFGRGLLTGAARGYGGAVMNRRANQQQQLEAQNQQRQMEYQQQTRDRDRNMMYAWPQIARQLTEPTPQQELEAATAKERALLAERAKAPMSEYQRRQLELEEKRIRVSQARQAGDGEEKFTPRQKEQLSAVDRKYEDKRDIVKRRILGIEKLMDEPFNRSKLPQLQARLEAANAELDSLGTAWSDERGRIVGTVKEQPATPAAQQAPTDSAAFWREQMRLAPTVDSLRSILSSMGAANPELVNNKELRKLAKDLRKRLEGGRPVGEGTTGTTTRGEAPLMPSGLGYYRRTNG